MNCNVTHNITCRLQQIAQIAVMLTEELRGAGIACVKPHPELAAL